MRILTTDIYEGAYLLSQGMNLERLWVNGRNVGDPERSRGGKRSVVFQFDGTEAEILRNRYLKGKAEANVTKLKQSLTELKDQMFNLIRSAAPVDINNEFQALSVQRRRRENEQSGAICK